MNKPIAYSGVDYPINQLSSDRRFEKLLHRIFEYRIKDDLKDKFDKATLMQGGSERGRDVLLQRNGKVNGVIQCKMNTSGNLSKEKVSKEIIKFALYYYQDNSLVDDLESFIYYFVCSDKFTGSSIELLVDFKSKILKEEKLEEWIKSVLRGFSTFKELVYEDIEIELKKILVKLIVKPKTESEINGWLQKKGYENVVSEFFEVRTVYVDRVIENSLPIDQSRYITIELEPIDNDNFKIIIWVESKENNYLEVKFSDDKTYTKNEIVNIIDNFIDKNYKDVSSRKIFLLFSLPTQLMKEDINFWKLEDEKLLGRKYKVLLRGKERFRKDRRSEKLYRYKDWKENWNIIKNKKSMESISKIKCIINKEDNEDINSEEVAETPLVIMKYEPNEESFIRLYKSAIPLVMWANNCVDFNEFENIFDKETHKNIKLCELKEKLYKFIEKRHSKVDANIMLMYDNPNNLAPDGGATRYNIPE